MLAWRLLLATGDPAYADLIERTIFNGVLPSVSTEGTAFFYVNPLQRRTHRRGRAGRWRAGAVVPVRLLPAEPDAALRLVAHISRRTDDGGVHVHQYASARSRRGDLRLSLATDYPWTGRVRVEIVAAPEASGIWLPGSRVGLGGAA